MKTNLRDIRALYPIGTKVFRWSGKERKHKLSGVVDGYEYMNSKHYIKVKSSHGGWWMWLPNDPLLHKEV